MDLAERIMYLGHYRVYICFWVTSGAISLSFQEQHVMSLTRNASWVPHSPYYYYSYYYYYYYYYCCYSHLHRRLDDTVVEKENILEYLNFN